MKIYTTSLLFFLISLNIIRSAASFIENPNSALLPRISLKSSRTSDEHYTKTHSIDRYSWKQYYSQEKQYVKEFKKQGILYKKSVLTNQEFNTVREELSNLSLNLVQETTNSVAHNRIGAQIPANSKIIETLSNPEGSFMKIINEITVDNSSHLGKKVGSHKDMVLSASVPVEIRVYEQRGAGMEWHKDDLLYEPEQIEVVFTVENNSDCITMWEESITRTGDQRHSTQLRQVETEANSAIILRAGPSGARHSVSTLKSGKRTILKFVFARKDAIFLEGAKIHTNQFNSRGGKRQKKRNKNQ